jgi:hypothetical protein
MAFTRWIRLFGAGALALALAGCFDMTMELEVLDDASARTTTIQTMPAEIYSLIASLPPAQTGGQGFCTDGKGALVTNPDGSATCTETTTGSFAELEAADRQDSFDIAAVSPGTVRLTFRNRSVTDEIEGQVGADPQVRALVLPMFEGRNMTVRVLGRQLIDTNMTPTADGRGAELVIPFTDLIEGTLDVPDEIFAVVRTGP